VFFFMLNGAPVAHDALDAFALNVGNLSLIQKKSSRGKGRAVNKEGDQGLPKDIVALL
jgi:hypothetical protein